MAVELRPLAVAEYPAFRERSIADYAADHVHAGYCSPEQGRQRAEDAYNGLLPQGLDTPGHHIFRLHENGPVGYLWVQVRADDAIPSVFIYDLEIDAQQRDRGLGRVALQQLQNWCQQQGISRLELSVVGDNSRALHLYESLGFSAIRQTMRWQFGGISLVAE